MTDDPFGLDSPSLARIHDHLLGGQLHNAVDRTVAQSLTAVFPSLPRLLAGHRTFLQQAVSALTRLGVAQFLELGSGVPTWGHVHHVAQQQDPDVRVVYVDSSANTVALGQEVLTGTRNTTMIQADLTNPQAVLHHPLSQSFLDYTEPIAVLMIGALDLVTDSGCVNDLVSHYSACSSATTFIAVTHLTTDYVEGQLAGQFAQLAARHQELTGVPLVARPRVTLDRWLQDTTLLCPGVSHPVQWRQPPGLSTDPDPVDTLAVSVVAKHTPAA